MSLVKEVNRKRILDAKIQEYGRSYARKQCKEEMDTYFGCIKGLLIYIYIYLLLIICLYKHTHQI